MALGADVSDEEQARGFVSGVNEQLGGLDILVNNARVRRCARRPSTSASA